MVDPPNCVSDPPNSHLSGHADPPTSQRYFERWWQRSQVVDLISRNIFLSLYVIKLEWQTYYGIFINVKNYQFINITYLYQCFPNIEICNMGIFVMCEILLEVGLLDTSSLVRPIPWINSLPWIKIVNGNSGNVIVNYAVAMDAHF